MDRRQASGHALRPSVREAVRRRLLRTASIDNHPGFGPDNKGNEMKTTKRYVVAFYPASDKSGRLHLVSASPHKHSFKTVEEAEAFSASRHFETGVYTIYTQGTTLRSISEAFCDQLRRPLPASERYA